MLVLLNPRIMSARTIALLPLVGALWANAQALPEEASTTNYVMRNGEIIGQLELDTAQARKLRVIEADYQRAFDRSMTNDSLSEAALATSIDSLGRRREADIRSILTTAQYERWVRMAAAAEPH